MSPEEFEEEVDKIIASYSDDPEALHSKVDLLMEWVLHQLGYHEGIDKIVNLVRWYA